MEFGIFHEFLTTQAGSQQEAFRNSFAQIAAAEEWGLDVVWLAEIHMNPTRSLLSAPLTVAAAIAARTERIKIGTAVQILPLGHPLRLAEETATIDQISNGRLIFGVGRSAFPRAYNAYGISYEESPQRFAESLAIIKKAWTEPEASYQGRWHSFENFTLVPRPVQQPHPEIRIAASQHDTYAAIGALGYPLFSAVRATPLSELPYHTQAYREAWAEAGHAGEPRAYLQVPIYVAATREAALATAEAGLMRFSTYRADLIRGPMNYETARREKGIVGTPEMVTERLMELRDKAHLAGVSAEINPGSLLSHEQVMESLRLYIQEVMPNFE
ncbi:MAG TPA: LLM class flavin-dependent oxidoreductase [Stellaceae bacterium]|jgi:alkanesulfonate monooxygenase SsuD/methylene tetrahydromethanopterin reductase-like flavin-dependent oxidoreductase (luciferase family)|nr:LLM class flavin-dependent oxidoreductase [Stellaceae bacterium]